MFFSVNFLYYVFFGSKLFGLSIPSAFCRVHLQGGSSIIIRGNWFY